MAIIMKSLIKILAIYVFKSIAIAENKTQLELFPKI